MSVEVIIWTKSQLCKELNKVGTCFKQGYGLPVSNINDITNCIDIVMIDNHIINGNYANGTLEPLLLVSTDVIDIKPNIQFPLYLYKQHHSNKIILTYDGEVI